MDCPNCAAAMREETLDAHHGRSVVVDICSHCQACWFDARESPSLTPGATLTLFRIIGEHAARPQARARVVRCPRCRSVLRRTHDMQRATRFEYLSCRDGHGRFISFFDFLREKDFIRPLTPRQVAELRRSVQSVNCSNCGAPVDVQAGAACGHCGSPLSMLDMQQADALLATLQRAEARAQGGAAVDPALPLALARARRETETAFAFERDERWLQDASSAGLVGAGLMALARWLKRDA
ncbi:MAG: zf-TFIIB domain-containing protein [Vicinamibacterales bacterium]